MFEFAPGRSKKQQVADDLRRRIRASELQIGDSLGDIFRMAEHYSCSFCTVRAAQQILVDEGLLSEIRPGVPTRVIAVPAAQNEGSQILLKLVKLRNELDELIAGLQAG